MKLPISKIIYTRIIDPVLSAGQRNIIDVLDSGDTILDVACGIGSLSLAMAGKASHVTGIDLSEEMIDIATGMAGKMKRDNLRYNLKDASDLSDYPDNFFSVAVTSMAVHQFDPGLAIRILKEMKRIAIRIIIMDYNYPMQRGISSLIAVLVEWMAGGDHYRNFRKYNHLGGLSYYVSQSGLIIDSELYRSSIFKIISCV
jgi:2-polyprenyl-3-methyl-5-hydroxy-6-metoxy-1,4-benzoquinol methylase